MTGWTQRLLIQSQYYPGDSGSVSHKTVDQAKASRRETAIKLGEVRFLEYLDGAGFFASLNTDLRTLLDMEDTAGIIQIRSTPVRLRREMQLVGFLTPIEIEHAILIAGTDRKKVAAVLTADGYNTDEIERAITAALKNELLEQPNENSLRIAPSRWEQARRYFLLDMAAIEGKTLTRAESNTLGLLLVPGYGPFHGLPTDALRAAAEERSPSLKPDWSVGGVFEGDLAWLTERGYAVVNSETALKPMAPTSAVSRQKNRL